MFIFEDWDCDSLYIHHSRTCNVSAIQRKYGTRSVVEGFRGCWIVIILANSEGEYSIRMSAHELPSTEYSLLKYSQVCRALHN